MANEKTPFAGLNILNAGSYYNWPDRNADNTIIDENLKELTDFENLKKRYNYEVTQTNADGLYTFTTVIKNDAGEEIARRVVTEEAENPESYLTIYTTEIVNGVEKHYKTVETATGFEKNEVI